MMALKLVVDDGTELVLSDAERAWYEFVIEWVAHGAYPYLDELAEALCDAGVLRAELLGKGQAFTRRDGSPYCV